MIYFEYMKQIGHPNYGIVTYQHFQPEMLEGYNTSIGLFVESIPEKPAYESGYEYVLYYNEEDGSLFYKKTHSVKQEEGERPLFQREIMGLIHKELTDPNRTSSVNYYNLLDKEKATLEEVRDAKYFALKEECDKHILFGFYSASTGARYGFSETDQMNMTQQMILFFINPSPIMWKTEDKGLISLTKEKFLTLAFEAQAHKEKQINNWWKLKANILAAQTKEEIMAFEWDGTIL